VDVLIANSHYIARCIEQCYGRQAEVVYPFQDTERFRNLKREVGEFYLVYGAIVPNKRVDLAIEAIEKLGRRLVVAGVGQDFKRLRKKASERIHFVGRFSDEQGNELLRTCRAMLFPGKEDFGITPLEAMACGTPVIAYGEGGAAESVIDRKTGILFRPQTAEALIHAIDELEAHPEMIKADDCRARAREFSRERFLREFDGILRRSLRAGSMG
jgi:glycosyltransferase involved in cell wall biosynthesis